LTNKAQYTDMLILNKHELVSERKLETCVDRILDLELDVQIPRVLSQRGRVDKALIFGIDAKLAQLEGTSLPNGNRHAHALHPYNVYGGDTEPNTPEPEDHQHPPVQHNHQKEVEVLSVTLTSAEEEMQGKQGVHLENFYEFLNDPTKEEVYRIKGIVYSLTPPKSSDGEAAAATAEAPGRYILNWAFGRWTFIAAPTPLEVAVPGTVDNPIVRLTVITAPMEITKWKKRIEACRWVIPDPGAGVLKSIEVG